MLEVEVHQVLVAPEHLVAERLLRQAIEVLVGDDRVLAAAPIAIEVADGGLAPQVAPPLYDVRRMIDVVHGEISLVGEFFKCIEVILLVLHPVGIHLPEHPLRRHLVEAGTAPGIACAVGRNLQLEGMAELVGKAVEFAVLNAVGSHPQCTDEVVVGATIGGAVEGIHDHDHHLILVGLGTGQRELQRVAEEMIERFDALLKILQVEAHGMAIEGRRILQVVAEAPLPEKDEVVGLRRALVAPLRRGVVEIHALQILRNKDFLLCNGRSRNGNNKNSK